MVNMTCYIITYDLVNDDSDYDILIKEIKTYSKWAHINKSTWSIITEDSAKEIRDNLKKKVNSEDRLFVIKSGVEAAWSNAMCKTQWLKDNL